MTKIIYHFNGLNQERMVFECYSNLVYDNYTKVIYYGIEGERWRGYAAPYYSEK